jgi:hypothetical protein
VCQYLRAFLCNLVFPALRLSGAADAGFDEATEATDSVEMLELDTRFTAIATKILEKVVVLTQGCQGRDSPIFLQFFYLFSIFFLNCF